MLDFSYYPLKWDLLTIWCDFSLQFTKELSVIRPNEAKGVVQGKEENTGTWCWQHFRAVISCNAVKFQMKH